MTAPKIDYPPVVSRSEWREARKQLLAQEKAHTRARDHLNAERRRLPMVLVEEPYAFEGPQGKLSLLDLFEDRLQLIVYHFMWLYENGKPLDRGCPSCSGWADGIARGHLAHLHGCSTSFALVSRAPLDRITPFRARMGWTMPWYSSADSKFNFDFHVSLDDKVAPVEYNYRTRAEHERAGTAYYLEGTPPFDLPGISCFLRDGKRIYHTYSAFARGCESVGGSSYFLDLTALGRQEEWEEPKGRLTGLGTPAGSPQIRYPDETGEAPTPTRARAGAGKDPSCCD
jgi:predicted dithiol-disulfide oxidoreductase (DUF899 family)